MKYSAPTLVSPTTGNRRHRVASFTAVLLLAISGTQPLAAELESLDQNPWFGYFTGYSSKKFQIGLTTKGSIKLNALTPDQKPVNPKLEIPIAPIIEETLPDGTIIKHKIDPDTLLSPQKPTLEIEKITFQGQGKATGGATAEFTLEQNRGTFLVGGRMLDSGTLKNPLAVSWHVAFTSPYPFSKSRVDEKSTKIFQNNAKRDSITLKWPDSKTLKISTLIDTEKNNTPLESTVHGIREATVDISSFGGVKFTFLASPNSSITLNSRPPKSLPTGLDLLEGFSFDWRPDPGKDPDSKAKFAIQVN